MSLAGLESAVLQLVVDALEDCGFDAPDQAIRHHGNLPTIPGCCTEPGVLACSWAEAPTPGECEQPGWALEIRWSTCWPEETNPISYPSRDATSARIADVAECVLAALNAAVCKWGPNSSLFPYARSVKLGRTTPIPADGKCAGVVWRLNVVVRSAEQPPT